jgi:hypothetical protein
MMADAADCSLGPAEGCACTAEGTESACGTETGSCVTGMMKCLGGHWGECRGQVDPMPEDCNGVDDDCDGQSDEGCTCGEGATLPCGTDEGACVGGVQRCEGGKWSSCVGSVLPASETCNAMDDDCDGATDEGCSCVDGNTMPCGVDRGACRAGTQTCSDGVWGLCLGGAGPSSEVCDGVDNDCNGTVDEGGNGCGGACVLSSPPGSACDGPDGDVCTDDVQNCASPNSIACSSGATNPGCTSCAGLGGTICETGGNGACRGIGPGAYECDHCCGGSASPSCGALGGTRCGAGACAGDGPSTYDCDRCCGGSIATCGYLWPGQGLSTDQSRTSCDGRFTLVMQGDSNLVLYWNGVGALFATGTNPTGANFAIMQGDGNFVVYSPAGAVWSSNTYGNPGAFLAIQTDGNLVVYSPGGVALWNSGTCCH